MSVRSKNMLERLNTKLEKYHSKQMQSSSGLSLPTSKQATSKNISNCSGQKKKRKMEKLQKELEKFEEEQIQIKGEDKFGVKDRHMLTAKVMRKIGKQNTLS